MTQSELNRECAAMDSKITLAKLEVSKAEERVAELEYTKARFIEDVTTALAREEGLQAEKAKMSAQTQQINP